VLINKSAICSICCSLAQILSYFSSSHPSPCPSFSCRADLLALGLTRDALKVFVLNVSSGWNANNFPRYLIGFVPHLSSQISLSKWDWPEHSNKNRFLPLVFLIPSILIFVFHFTLHLSPTNMPYILHYIYHVYCILPALPACTLQNILLEQGHWSIGVSHA
jgi:hypothetical protein